ncbi:MAG: ArsR family transcriptional regulator [Chloroflexi bacterium]|nr:MAG: ArsR family transcriptional regulator [Chloroflexota bacterium]
MTNQTMTDEASIAKKGTWQDEACIVPGADISLVSKGLRLLGAESLYADLAEVFRALADPSRAKIVHSLLHQELCTCDLAAIVSLSEPGVSQHLRILRNLRVVKARRAGRRVFYSLDDAHVRELLSLSLSHLGHGAASSTDGA